VTDFLPEVDTVLVMSVNPGFGGQAFMSEVLPKIAQIAKIVTVGGHPVVIEVDGGIDQTTAPLATAAGARLLVAGSAIFGAADPARALDAIRLAGAAALRG
jgi:ribulose-phosphate 3-epimerase